MAINATVPEAQNDSAAPASAPAAAPILDAAAQEALEKAEAAQGARVALAEVSAPKPAERPAVEADEGVSSTPPVPPTAPATPAEAKEPEFLDSVLKYYDSSVERGKGPVGATFDAILYALTSGSSKLWDWVKGLFNGKKKEEKTAVAESIPESQEAAQAEDEDPRYRTEDEYYEPDDPETKKLLVTAEKQLDSALDKNPTWLGFAQEAGKKFNIAVPTLFAFVRFESAFNASAVNGTVAGLGQFWGPTWETFMAENPEFKGASRTDPRASFYATAWYARKNATECKIDTDGPNAAALLYEAHHEGAGGFAQLQAFRRGEITGKQRIPKTYAGKSFPKFGVPLVDTYANYAKLVTAMSAKVQTVADFYKTELPEAASQTLNS